MVSDVLMSIRPRYADAIFSGAKTVELRRRRPSFARGARILVYSSSPSRRLQGTFVVSGVIAGDLDSVWAQVKSRAGVDRSAFDAYFAGCTAAYAIEIENPQRIAPAELGMRPPQSYLFLRRREPRHRRLLRLAEA